jgi:hypothetical protein
VTGEDEQQRALTGISEATYGYLPPSHLLPEYLSNNMTSSNTTEIAELAAQLRVFANDVSIGDVDEGFREIKKLSEDASMVQNRSSSSGSSCVLVLVDAHSHPVSSDPNIMRTSFGGKFGTQNRGLIEKSISYAPRVDCSAWSVTTLSKRVS